MDKNKQKTILITGGAGFVGSHLCERYLRDGHKIICLDNLQTTGSVKNIERLLDKKNFKFIKHDIIRPINFKEKIDWIFNSACSGSPTSYQYDPIHTTKTNTVGVINMLELAKKNSARIMQFSTSEVYGDPLVEVQSEGYNGNVNPLGPRACYDEGKRCAETLFMDYYREYGVDIKIIRIFNTYGPKMDVNDGRAMTNFIVNALSGKDIIIYGDGSYTRSFQYIDDLAAGIDLMMNKNEFIGPVNLGNPGEISILSLAKKIIEETKSNSKIVMQEKPTDDPKRRCPDIGLAKEKLGWQPIIPLADGLAKTIEYFKTVELPEKRVLAFTIKYYPDLGPAEQALADLAREMPDTEFHIITAKSRKGLPKFEKINNTYIYRLGYGLKLDKYILAFCGAFFAGRLDKKYKFKFVWSVMSSYGALAALTFKLLAENVFLLLIFSQSEIKKRGTVRAKLAGLMYRLSLKSADSVFLSDVSLERNLKLIESRADFIVRQADRKSFVNQVRYTYAKLINKQEKKLERYK
jgi:UDP-glucuronate decarboxylase